MSDALVRSCADRLSRLSQRFGVTLPDVTADFDLFDLSDEAERQNLVARHAIHVGGLYAPNHLFLHKAAGPRPGLTIIDLKGVGNVAVIGARSGFQGQVRFYDDGNLAVLSGEQAHLGLEAHLSDASVLLCGRETFAWSIRVWAFGGAHCVIGDDCLFSDLTSMRTTDHHSLIDLATWRQTNFPADIVFERHVWVGQNSQIAKGVRIGAGAVVGQGSTVTRSIPSCELWGGAPARPIRKNISWVRSHPAEAAELEALRALLPAAPANPQRRFGLASLASLRFWRRGAKTEQENLHV
ncbi:hypothetical protein GJ654_02360 [Rhodoblastus acidophilus]|uniref:Acyltransferase n=1 Tax=Rhodoblastus acidophilus TaxID=1074 RepID=A0A6N8DM33_RHOAC|nr:acyltransferase [Rhodoblastus acidophilus]MCW2272927.1 acetyltransferase-like isoleucine patch superfamily enzyme [Rhodoblastus acidophilus]MTV29834.1 hypothetical protein [Rhodoblastus acidophilus]